MNLRETLKNHCASASIAKYADLLAEFIPKYEIDTPLRQRHFLAQLLHESGGLSKVRENLNYSADGLLKTFSKYFSTTALANQYAHHPEQIANQVYANRMGNGTVASGDGWRFIGRGLIQTTGRTNYTKTSQALFGDNRLLEQPQLLEEPRNAVESACYFWKANNLNALADRNDMVAVTRAVNGGTNGLADRQKIFNELQI